MDSLLDSNIALSGWSGKIFPKPPAVSGAGSGKYKTFFERNS